MRENLERKSKKFLNLLLLVGTLSIMTGCPHHPRRHHTYDVNQTPNKSLLKDPSHSYGTGYRRHGIHRGHHHSHPRPYRRIPRRPCD